MYPLNNWVQAYYYQKHIITVPASSFTKIPAYFLIYKILLNSKKLIHYTANSKISKKRLVLPACLHKQHPKFYFLLKKKK